MTTQEKINALTPFQQEDFITCDVEYDFSLCVHIWQRITLDQWTENLVTPDDNDRVTVDAETSGNVDEEYKIMVEYSIYATEGVDDVTIDELLDVAIQIVGDKEQ
jgi:hypothetical protein